jgi:hypothetical protein
MAVFLLPKLDVGQLYQLPDGLKICELRWFSVTAVIWTSCQCGRLQKSAKTRPMFLRLEFEPKKTTSFQILPVKSTRTAKTRRFT